MGNITQLNAKKQPHPCPFCGDDGPEFDLGLPGVRCDACGATGPVAGDHGDYSDDEVEEAAVAFWNKRKEGGAK